MPSRADAFVLHAAAVLPKTATVDDLRAIYPPLKRGISPGGVDRCARTTAPATNADLFLRASRSARALPKGRPAPLGVPVRSSIASARMARGGPNSDGTTDEESAAEERKVTNAEVLQDPVYSGRPRYEFPLFHRGSAMISQEKVREGCEVARSIVQTSIFSPSWLPVEVPDDITALDPTGIDELEDLIRLGALSLVVDKINIFGLGDISDLAIGMSLCPNSTVRTTRSEDILRIFTRLRLSAYRSGLESRELFTQVVVHESALVIYLRMRT